MNLGVRTQRFEISTEMQVFRGKSITISCTNKNRSAAFYGDVLGAIPQAGDGFGCQWYRLGDIVFSLLPNAEARSPVSFPRDAVAMLWLEVDDLAEAQRRIEAAGSEIVQAADGQSMLIADPDGLLIEVWQRER